MAEKNYYENNQYGSGIFVAGNIDIGGIGVPADSRLMVENLEKLAWLVENKRVYDGMIVYCKATGTYHKCSVDWNSDMSIASASWKQVEIQSLEELKALIAQESTAAMEFKGTIKDGVLPALEEGKNYDGNLYKVTTKNVTVPAALNAEGEVEVVAKPGDSLVCEGGKWYLIPSGDDIENTWRAIKVNGVEKLGGGITSGDVDFVQGDNVTITEAGGVITIAAADTHYESKLVAANSATDAADETAEDGQVHLNLVENGEVKSSHKIVGGGGISVTHTVAEGEDGVNVITIEAPEGAKYDLAAKTENNEAILSLAGTDNTEDKVAIVGNDAVAVTVDGGKIKISAHDTKYTGSEGSEIKVGATDDGAITAELTEAVRTKLNKTWEEVGVAAELVDDLKNNYVGTFTHDTAKTVVDYINAKTDGIATSGNLEALGQRVTAVENDIKNNRDAWEKDDNDNTTYQFSIPTSGDDKGKLLVEKKEIGETAWTRVNAYDFTTPDELTEALANYYTEDEIDGIVEEINGKINGIDTGVHAVALAGGTNNGTLKLTVDGNDVDNIAVTGLQDAAYATVASLNATAKGYADAVEAKIPTELGVMSVAKGDDTITIGGTAQNPTIAVTANKFDAYGAAAQALKDAKAYADAKPHENTAHTHSVGDGLKKTGDGGINGDVKYELNVAMKLEDGDIVIYDKDNNNEVARLDAAELLEDSYLNDVEIVNNELQFTWKMDDGTTKTDSVDLKHLVDVYSGLENDYIKVTVSGYNISATLKKVDTAIIEDSAVTYDKLHADVQGVIDAAQILDAAISVQIDPDAGGPCIAFNDGHTFSYEPIYVGEYKEEKRLITKEELDGSIDGLGGLASKDTVGTSDIDDGAITYDKLDENLQSNADYVEDIQQFIGTGANRDVLITYHDGAIFLQGEMYRRVDDQYGTDYEYHVATIGDVQDKIARLAGEGNTTTVKANKKAIDAINNVDTGILAQAKKDAGDKAAVVLGEAQKYTDALLGSSTDDSNAYSIFGTRKKLEEVSAAQLTKIEADTGLKVSTKAENKQTISIDDSVVFILDCNW